MGLLSPQPDKPSKAVAVKTITKFSKRAQAVLLTNKLIVAFSCGNRSTYGGRLERKALARASLERTGGQQGTLGRHRVRRLRYRTVVTSSDCWRIAE